MIQLKNVNDLIAYLLRECDQETIELLFEGQLIPIENGSSLLNKCSLKALRFVYSKLPKTSERVQLHRSYDNGENCCAPVDLPEWITKDEYNKGMFYNTTINVREIISKLGYYIDEELGELLDSSSNSDGEGHDCWERLYYLKNEKFRSSQRLRDIIREEPEKREFLRHYNKKSKRKMIIV